MLTREAIFEAGQRRDFVDVDCTAEAGGVVRVAVMTGTERDRFDAECARSADSLGESAQHHLRAVLVCLTVSDDSGGRLLSMDDAETVKAWQAPLLWRLYTAAFDVNRLGRTEALEKN